MSEAVMVSNAMTGEALGRVGNLSVDGMMLITGHDVPDECLYQLQFQLRDREGLAHKLEVGVQCLWSEAARVERTFWVGCKIIDISEAEQQLLNDWVERAAEVVN